MVNKSIVALALFAPFALAQQGEWQQCGGINWSGGTTCVAGTTCTYLNDWYYQCLPGSSTTSKTTSKSTSTTKTTTTTTSTTTTRSTSKSTSTSTSTTSVGPTATPNYWFSFGDSYTQTQFDPNGTLPSPGNPLGNPPYPGYTAVGGVNWIDVDTVLYNNSLIFTYNYAYGGATINATLVAPYESTVLSLGDQVNQFLTGAGTKPPATPWTSKNSLFSFWIGINDIGNSYYESGDRDAFSDTLLDNYFELVDDVTTFKVYISNVGARNFLFINVPPIDRSPLMQAEPVSAQQLEATVIAGFNSKLAQRVAQLSANYTGVSTWLWDSNAAFTTVLNDPTAYGFIDNTSYGNTGDFWGNNYHPSSAAQTIWGQDIAALLSGTVW